MLILNGYLSLSEFRIFFIVNRIHAIQVIKQLCKLMEPNMRTSLHKHEMLTLIFECLLFRNHTIQAINKIGMIQQIRKHRENMTSITEFIA